ncbi:MAG: response regulator [Gammaproteobacteria bacterium]
MAEIRVLLAEDHTLVRAGIRALLDSFDGITVVGEASDGREAARQARELQPDVILMDIAMPGLNGLEATSRIARTCPGTRVLILTMHSNEEYVVQALRAGASGYLVKEAATGELHRVILSVARGQTYLSPSISRCTVERLMEDERMSVSSLDQLTPRQREILQLLAEGRSTRDIAALLSVSVKTVETHRARLMERLDIRDIPGLVRIAIREGLISR